MDGDQSCRAARRHTYPCGECGSIQVNCVPVGQGLYLLPKPAVLPTQAKRKSPDFNPLYRRID